MKTLWVLEGPTAVGKTSLAIEWAKSKNTEIISADSRQFYKELSIGVARPNEEELQSVKHHFIATKSIFEPYSVSHFEQEAMEIIKELFKTHDSIVLTGGSGLYIQALCCGMDDLPDADPILRKEILDLYEKNGLEGLRHALKIADPVFYSQVDLCNHTRIRRALEVCYLTGKPFSSFRLGELATRHFEIKRFALNRPREELYQRINDRVDIMMSEGLEQEARLLLPYRHLSALQTVGYRELFSFFDGSIDRQTAIDLIKMNSRRYAKRQITWLKNKTTCSWIDVSEKK